MGLIAATLVLVGACLSPSRDVSATMAAALETMSGPPQHRLARLRVPVATRSLTRVRGFAARTCRTWDCDPVADDACPIAHELVVNAVRHAHTDAILRLDLRPGTMLVAVSDGDPQHPVIARRDQTGPTTSGYGLALVAGLARSWGTVSIDGGKIVWAVILA